MTTEPTLNVTTFHNSTGNTVVCWRWKEAEGFLVPGEAINQALTLLNVAAIAESEARIAEEIGKATKSPKDLILGLTRMARAPLPPGINPIFGQATQRPLVECFWYGDRICLGLDEARHHAQCLLEAAESARTDNFLVSAFQDAGLNPELRERVFESYRKYRQRMEK